MQRCKVRKTGRRKDPASPSEVSKVVAGIIPASVSPLKQAFDDDAGEEPPNSRGDKDEKDLTIHEAGPSVLADVEVISRKGAKLIKKGDSQNNSNFRLPSLRSRLLHDNFNIILYINNYCQLTLH